MIQKHLVLPALLVVCVVLSPQASADTPAIASSSGSSPTNSIFLEVCRVFSNDMEVPALEEGALVVVHVSDGQLVQKGKVLAQIDDRQVNLELTAAKMQYDAAMKQASDDISVRFAQASFEVANEELLQGLEANRRRANVVSASEMRRRRLAKYRAQLEIDKSRLNLEVAKMNADVSRASVDLANESIRRRKIVSPIDGQVMPIYRGNENQRVCQVGQWVQTGEPIVRIVRMDPLYVEGLISASKFMPSAIDGASVTVQAVLARGRREEFHGRINLISATVDKRNHFRVRAEVQNRTENGHWLMRPGSVVGMTVHMN